MSEGQALPTGAVQIDGYPGYAVDSFGSVYSHRWGRWRRLKGFSNSNGYLRVYLCRDGERARAFVHVLVAKSFVGSQPFDGAEVRHLDGNRLNNCCENLAWGTHSDNMHDMIAHGRHISQAKPERLARGERHGSRTKPHRVPRGEASGRAIITEKHVRAIRALYDLGFTLSDIARVLCVSRSAVKGVANQNNWSHVDKEAS